MDAEDLVREALCGGPRARVVRVGLLGYGRIGQAVAALAAAERDRLADFGVDLRCETALVRNRERPRPGAPMVELLTDGARVITGVDVVVEALGGVEPARTLVAAALRAGVPVVTANKSLVAAHGPELRALAARSGAAFLCEASVLAGVPCLGALARRPLASSVRSITGILNGTTHFILSAIERGASFDEALAQARAFGYAESDSRADISGRDAAEKLTVLLQLAGCETARVDDLPTIGIDRVTAVDFECARRLGGTLKPVVLASLPATADDAEQPSAWVGPAFVAADHPFAQLDGVTNALELSGDRGRAARFTGPGAGPEITAATVIDDVVEALTIVRERAIDRRAAPRSARLPTPLAPPPASWFIRIGAAEPVDARDVAEFFAAHHVPALQVVTVGRHLAARTVRAPWAAVEAIVSAFEARGASVLALPIMGTEVSSKDLRQSVPELRIEEPTCDRTRPPSPTVLKIGGSVLTDRSAYARLAAALARRCATDATRLVVVVSAEYGRTDALLAEAQAVTAEPDQDALDLLWSTGELRSVALLTLHLRAAGVSAAALNVHEAGLRVEPGPTGVERLRLNALALCVAIASHAVVVVPGFLATDRQRVVTLGRGGSDWSAVVLAASLGASRCELIKDVPGYFTADPHAAADARPIPRLGYAEALRMADGGCPLVQREAIVAAAQARLPIVVRSLDGEGTLVGPERSKRATHSPRYVARTELWSAAAADQTSVGPTYEGESHNAIETVFP